MPKYSHLNSKLPSAPQLYHVVVLAAQAGIYIHMRKELLAVREQLARL